MLYHLFQWLSSEGIKFPGSGLFQFITFRALMAILLSLIITLVYGKRIIGFLQHMQVGESVRELGLAGEEMNAINIRIILIYPGRQYLAIQELLLAIPVSIECRSVVQVAGGLQQLPSM